ncbi:MAG: hypothetical protein M3209_11795 [Acidobacteriota bacterium]|nr:hypothetical protein [Acidobacteriota bacterium]
MKTHLHNLIALCIIFLLLVLGCDSEHTADAELEKNFYKHEAEFNLLAQMAIQDADMIRIAPNFTWHKDNANGEVSKAEYGFSDERWNEYKQLFTKLGKNDGILNYQPDRILVIASSRGLVTGGSSKGYAYSPKEPSPIVSSLDNFTFKDYDYDSSKTYHFAYKQLKDNWYLYYQVSN